MLPSATFLAPGTRLGPYEVLGELGSGGMAVVYEARQVALNKRVAIKILRPEVGVNDVARARFVREGRAAARLSHPNVVNVFDVGEQGGLSYLVMERLSGMDLARLLHDRGALSPDEVVALALPIISAVAAAHDQGVIHRDLKPGNIFVAMDRLGNAEPKVLDFGISKVADTDVDASLTETEARIGTVRYMSPEQTRSSKNVDTKTDQYALGVILYECTTGRAAFGGTSAYEIMHAIVTSTFAPPRSINPSIPPELEAIIVRAMSGHADFRYPTVRELGAALLAFATPGVRARWQRELIGTANTVPHARASRPPADGTAIDASEADRPVVSGHAGGVAPRHARWAIPVGALGVAAVAAAVAFARAPQMRGAAADGAPSAPSGAPPVVSGATPPASTASLDTAPAHPPGVDMRRPGRGLELADAGTASAPGAAPSAASPATSAAPAPPTTGGGRSRAPAPRGAAASSSAAPSKPCIGPNGAIIIPCE